MLDIFDTNLPTEEVAKKLLGYQLISESSLGETSGWIVETEAYLGAEDMAAHLYQLKKTPRIQAMYEGPGTIYLYQMMGHTLLNIITRDIGEPQGVLIRAIQPNKGIELMTKRRRKITGYDLTNGPGKLSEALDITMKEYGSLITEPPLHIDFSIKKEPKKILKTPRIGIPNKEKWTEAPLRYIVKENPYVSHRRGQMDYEHYGWLR